MAVLRNLKDNRRYTLAARTLIGRAPHCTLCVESLMVSGEHARIVWAESQWVLRDLGSSNGTWLADQQLQVREDYPLSLNAQICFGKQSIVWVLEDDAPPVALARSLNSGEERRAVGGLLALPDDENPEVVIVEQSQGDWLIEGLGALRALRDQEVIQVGEIAWKMFVPMKLPSTIRPGGLGLHFRVSLDEEHVSLELRHQDESYPLGARAHNYLLLTLARQRVSDRRRGLPKSEQGWMHRDVLTRGLRLEYNHLNLLIHRARSTFSRAGVPGGAALLERRLDTGELRLGLANIEIQTAD